MEKPEDEMNNTRKRTLIPLSAGKTHTPSGTPSPDGATLIRPSVTLIKRSIAIINSSGERCCFSKSRITRRICGVRSSVKKVWCPAKLIFPGYPDAQGIRRRKNRVIKSTSDIQRLAAPVRRFNAILAAAPLLQRLIKRRTEIRRISSRTQISNTLFKKPPQPAEHESSVNIPFRPCSKQWINGHCECRAAL